MSLTLIVDSLLSLVMVIYHRVEALNCELCSFLVSFYIETNSKDYYKEVVILLKDNCLFFFAICRRALLFMFKPTTNQIS